MTRLVLLPSPLLGAASWAPVATELARRGHPVTLAAYDRTVRTPEEVLDELLAAVPDEPDLVLVPHSNAGLYVAALAGRRRLSGVVFADAGLPSSAAATPAAPPGLVEHLRALAGPDGLLPPWTSWWPSEDVDALFPDLPTRAAVEREQRRLPLSYFASTVPSPTGWEGLPGAFLAFGDAYADERDEARRRGWPVETLPGGHLHQLVDPPGVTDAVERLVALVTGPDGR